MRAWDEWLSQQEKDLGKEPVEKWLRPLRVTHFDAKNLYLEAETPFLASWFEEHHRNKITSSFLDNNGYPIRVHLKIQGSPKFQPKERKKGAPKEQERLRFELTFPELNPNATFENFIPNEANTLTLTLLSQLGSELKCNPLYLHGPRGSGKTHLLMALANAWKMKGFNTLYVTAKTFTEHVIAAIRASEMITFRQIYRAVDLLLIDDVDYFARKFSTQEELFHTFNTLHLANKPIVLAAPCPPLDLQDVEPRLVSRFEWGIELPLLPLEKEYLGQMIETHARAMEFPLSPKVCQFLIRTFVRSIHSLIGALEALILRAHLEKYSGELSVPLVERLLADLIREEKKKLHDPSTILTTVSSHFGITTEDLLSKGQTRDLVLPRQIAMYLCRETLKLPYKTIGQAFGRDHSTVMTSIRAVATSIQSKDSNILSHLKPLNAKLSD